jgi:hypothetical protein
MTLIHPCLGLEVYAAGNGLRIPGSGWLCCLSSIVIFKTVARKEIWELVFSVIKI